MVLAGIFHYLRAKEKTGRFSCAFAEIIDRMNTEAGFREDETRF